ncbi:MAG: hypothetical protein IJD75_02860 [Clostridia bacterium]|nr:hypothetical protein [Clostridia bacterium]
MENVFQEKHCGVTFGFYAKNGYFSSAKAREEIDEIARTGANWIVLVVTVMQESVHDVRQFRDFVQTPNDIEIKEIIDYIHGKGIHVQLRPMLECFDGLDRLSIHFYRDSERMPGLVYDRCSRWFEGMKARSVYYARIAEMTGCEMFCFDSELDRIIKFNEQWKDVIRAVREVYSGSLTSCHTIHTGVIDFEAVLSDKDHWFYELDSLSISDYIKIKAGADGGLSPEEISEHMKEHRDLLRRIAETYGKPVFFGEIGCSTTLGAVRSPSSWTMNTPYDETDQANYLEAVMLTFADEPWWHGLYWWKWDEHVARPWMLDPSMGDRGFTVRGKKSQEVMRKWFLKLRAERVNH